MAKNDSSYVSRKKDSSYLSRKNDSSYLSRKKIAMKPAEMNELNE